MCNKNNTTGVTRGAGIDYPFREHEFTPGFCLGSCCSIFIVWALFCMSFFYPFSIFKHVLALTIKTLFRKCKFCWKIYLINLVSFQALTTVQMILEFRATLQLRIVEVELLTHSRLVLASCCVDNYLSICPFQLINVLFDLRITTCMSNGLRIMFTKSAGRRNAVDIHVDIHSNIYMLQ